MFESIHKNMTNNSACFFKWCSACANGTWPCLLGLAPTKNEMELERHPRREKSGQNYVTNEIGTPTPTRAPDNQFRQL